MADGVGPVAGVAEFGGVAFDDGGRKLGHAADAFGAAKGFEFAQVGADGGEGGGASVAVGEPNVRVVVGQGGYFRVGSAAMAGRDAGGTVGFEVDCLGDLGGGFEVGGAGGGALAGTVWESEVEDVVGAFGGVASDGDGEGVALEGAFYLGAVGFHSLTEARGARRGDPQMAQMVADYLRAICILDVRRSLSKLALAEDRSPFAQR